VNKKGWKRIASVSADYSFGYTNFLGFAVDFCGCSGKSRQRQSLRLPVGTVHESARLASAALSAELGLYCIHATRMRISGVECAASDDQTARIASAAKGSAQPTGTIQLIVIAARVDTSGSTGT
jgi:hypothetical protein